MNNKTAIIIGVTLMLLISLIVSFIRSRKSNGLISFFYADNKLRISQVGQLLLSTSFSMNGLLYQTFLGYKIGWAAIMLQVIWCLSYLLLIRSAGKIKLLTAKGTMHSSISKIFGQTTGKLAAIATIIGFTIQVGWELIVGTSVFGSSFTNESNYSFWLIVVIAGICILYTVFGGLKGNVVADILQNWIAIFALICICGILFINYNPTGNERAWDVGSLGRLITELGVGGFITNALFSLFWQFVDFSTWQNLASGSGGEKSGKSTLWLSSLLIFVFPGVVGTFAGMYLRGVQGIDPNNLFSYIIGTIQSNTFLLIFVVAGFVAAMLSTIDGLLLATSQAAIWDLFFIKTVSHDLSENHPSQEKKMVNYGRLFIVFFGIMGSLLIFYITTHFGIDIFSLVYLVTIAQMILLPVILVVLYGNSSAKKFGNLSIGVGLLSGLIIVSYGIITKNQNLLTWSPTICLGVALLFQLPNLKRLTTYEKKV